MTSTRSSKKTPPSLDLVEDPFYLSGLITASQEARAIKATPLPSVLQIPFKTMPPLNPNFQRMGDSLGVCPYELQEIMTSCFDTNNTLVMEALKRLITAVKITNEVDVLPVRKKLQDIEDRHRQHIKDHERSKRERTRASNKKDKDFVTKTDEIINILYPILQNIKAKLKTNPKLDDLPLWEKKLVHAFKNYKATTARVGKNPTIQIKPCLDLIREKPEAIEEIMSLVRTDCDREIHHRFDDWLHSVSDEILYNVADNHEDPRVREKCNKQIHQREERERKLRAYERQSEMFRNGIYDREIWIKKSRWDGWFTYSDENDC